MHQSIVLTVDYHDQNCVIRRVCSKTGEERAFSVPTTEGDLRQVVAHGQGEGGRRGRIVWLQESTTGWARVQSALGDQVEFLLANVLQMPRPPKGHRRKTDKVDTARLQREYFNGALPLAHQPPSWQRQVRRVVACRENLVSRRTALRNWINRYLAHETWEDRGGLWSAKGLRRLKTLASQLPRRDGLVMSSKLAELDHLDESVAAIEAELLAVYHECP